MLAGLLFATHEAEDRPGALTATLPFAAGTLIEYQARLLVGAGASQIVVMVSRLTPELIGALARIGKRGVAVDAVRSAADALGKLHPLARVLMLADGLVTTDAVVAAMAEEGGDTLLVLAEDAAPREFERVGGNAAWAGIARLDAGRLADAAALPADYDVQSTLLHVARQHRARWLELPLAEMQQGHGIERHAAALEQRGRAVLAASLALRPTWFDRFVLRPIARLLVPEAARRGVATAALSGVGGALAVLGVAGIWEGWRAAGLVLALLATVAIEVAAALASFRDEAAMQRGLGLALACIPAIAALVLGAGLDPPALSLAIGAVVAGAISERAARPSTRRRWWGTPPACLALLTVAAIVGVLAAGLWVVALYASVTLIAAVEALRHHA